MNLLFSNDKLGLFPDSWYASTANNHKRYHVLKESIEADVCIIGAGYTGLSSALHLAEEGLKVVLLDAHRPGWGRFRTKRWTGRQWAKG